MTADQLPEDLLRSVTPNDARAYATSSGWLPVEDVPGHMAIYRPPDHDSFVQVAVPLRTATEDYADRMADVVVRFATREDRSPFQVLTDLLAVGADLLRFQVDGPSIAKGTVPFIDGFKLYEGARDSLIAAACGAVDPKKYYARTLRAAEDLLKACRMGQSERSSYIATVSCPAGVMPERERNGVPFGRQTTGLLLNTMAVVATAIERREENTLLEVQEEKAVVSANLCDAIVEMQPEDERTTLTVQCTWSKTLPQEIAIPRTISFKAEYREPIKRVADALRPKVEPRPVKDYIGTISALKSEPNIERRELGEVMLFISDAGRPVHVKVELPPDDYAVACIAHRDGRAVLVRGVLNRGYRIARIEHPSAFRIIAGGGEQ